MDDLTERIKFLNRKYEANNYNGIMKEKDCNYQIILGSHPIILSAAHAVKQHRDLFVKKSEIYTGGITEYLCNETGVYGIIRNCNLRDDPNYDNKGYGLLYKQAILSLIKEYGIIFLIDLHGCSNRYSFDIDVGTNNGKNVLFYDETLTTIIKNLSRLGKVSIDSKFKASADTNICKYVHDLANISCYQIEISQRLRVEETAKLTKTLKEMLEEIKRRIIAEKESGKGPCLKLIL